MKYDISHIRSTKQEIHRDNINHVFDRLVSNEETQDRAIRRISWIVESIQPGKVFDIGCSEGIADLMMADLGCEVHAIDMNPDVIDFARSNLSDRRPDLANKVTFETLDVFELNEIEAVYDSVVLGEVLEHVHDPLNLLGIASLAIQKGGRMVVTTPFGLAPADDHHQTFTPRLLLQHIPPNIATTHIDVIDGYIRLVGEKTSQLDFDPPPSFSMRAKLDVDDTTLLSITEKGLIESQTYLYQHLERVQAQLSEAREAAQRNYDRVLASNDRIKQIQESAAAVSAKLEEARSASQRNYDRWMAATQQIESLQP